jgi:hypothetical protein
MGQSKQIRSPFKFDCYSIYDTEGEKEKEERVAA